VTVHGTTRDRFAAVRPVLAASLASGADLGASFCATRDGETVVDIWGGHADPAKTRNWDQDTIVNVYSTTKTMTALTALLLADRAVFDLHDKVARFWPEFAAEGKGDITIAQLLSHSSGLSGWKEPLAREDLYDWTKCTDLLARQAPFWKPGTAPGYHALTQGYLVGEVIRRATGKSVGTVFREEIAGRLPPRTVPNCSATWRPIRASTLAKPPNGPGARPKYRRQAAPATPARLPRSTLSLPMAASPRANAFCQRRDAAVRSNARSKGPILFLAYRFGSEWALVCRAEWFRFPIPIAAFGVAMAVRLQLSTWMRGQAFPM
jgi:CubicO group peptidase (beta-lactamase class C family)